MPTFARQEGNHFIVAVLLSSCHFFLVAMLRLRLWTLRLRTAARHGNGFWSDELNLRAELHSFARLQARDGVQGGKTGKAAMHLPVYSYRVIGILTSSKIS